ncbi:MAG: hypothetical protein GY864_05640 [Desulfobacterales bacterium]|nr:hypothetical protein [Desulfobacterales bacterium]
MTVSASVTLLACVALLLPFYHIIRNLGRSNEVNIRVQRTRLWVAPGRGF